MDLVLAAILCYCAAALIVLRPLAGHFAWQMHHNSTSHRAAPPGDLWFGAYVGAGFLVCAWPAILICLFLGKLGPKIGAEKQAQIEADKKRLQQLERELDLELRS